LGYENLSLDQLIRMRSHEVTAAFIREARARGFNNLTIEQLINLRINGPEKQPH